MESLLSIQNLSVSVKGKPLLKNLSLEIGEGEIHAIMGPNGTGKSSLANLLSGHPQYEVTNGNILFQGRNLLDLKPEERAVAGLFIGFQHPVEIHGVKNWTFLMLSLNAHRKAQGQAPFSESEFTAILKETMDRLGIKKEFRERGVNEGFSGGEKKRNEILQLALLKPKLAVLDEIDSGLDIDALKAVAKNMKTIQSENPKQALLLITHYQRLLHEITPQFVHVMIDGSIVEEGGASLALEIEKRGYGTE